MGLPSDVVTLIEIWLKDDRKFFVSVNDSHSFIKPSEIGTVQGLILGLFFYALFVSPLFDLNPLKQIWSH